MIDSIISSAQAADAAAVQEPSVLSGILPLVLMIAVFYFLLIRPQQKKMKAHNELVSGLKKGDQVVTSGGIYGKVVKVTDASLELEIAKDTVMKLDRNSIATVLNGDVAETKGK